MSFAKDDGIHPCEKEQLPKNTLIIVRGLPGSGKTTLLKSAQEHLAFELIDPDITIQHPEEFEEYVRRRAQSDEKFGELATDIKLFRFHTHRCVEALKAGKVVVWAQPWSKIDGVRLTIENMRKLVSPDLIPVVIDLTVSYAEALKRVDARFTKGEHRLTPNKLKERFKDQFETVSDPIIIDELCIYMDLSDNPAEYNLGAFLRLVSGLGLLKPESGGTDC